MEKKFLETDSKFFDLRLLYVIANFNQFYIFSLLKNLNTLQPDDMIYYIIIYYDVYIILLY